MLYAHKLITAFVTPTVSVMQHQCSPNTAAMEKNWKQPQQQQQKLLNDFDYNSFPILCCHFLLFQLFCCILICISFRLQRFVVDSWAICWRKFGFPSSQILYAFWKMITDIKLKFDLFYVSFNSCSFFITQ